MSMGNPLILIQERVQAVFLTAITSDVLCCVIGIHQINIICTLWFS